MKCTWVGCNNNAEIAQKDNDGNIWANLCQEHHNKLQFAITEKNVPRLLCYWVKANGGAKKMAQRILDE